MVVKRQKKKGEEEVEGEWKMDGGWSQSLIPMYRTTTQLFQFQINPKPT